MDERTSSLAFRALTSDTLRCIDARLSLICSICDLRNSPSFFNRCCISPFFFTANSYASLALRYSSRELSCSFCKAP